jgi:hypothetical protein
VPHPTALSASWLAARWGLDPVAIEIRRRGGELFATRDEGAGEWVYPAWQLDEDGNVKTEVARVLAAAREARIPPERLDELFRRRAGLAGGRTLADSLREGDPGPVLAAIGSPRRSS